MRRTESITISEEGRDQGKTFLLTEMNAVAAERWATQAIYLLAESGVSVSEEQGEGGMSGLAGVLGSVAGGIKQLKALQDPSLSAWWECVRYQPPDAKLMPQPINLNEACQIEEIATVALLRMKVLELHTRFFSPEKASTSASHSQATHTASSPTRMSRAR